MRLHFRWTLAPALWSFLGMDRFWDIVGVVGGRLVMGGFAGFLVMLLVAWTAMYFDVMPPEPAATRFGTYLFFGVGILVALLGLRAAEVAFLMAPLFLLCAGVVMSFEALATIRAAPDLNGDGAFTIRDFLRATVMVLTAVGAWYLAFLEDAGVRIVEPVSTFLEIPGWLIAWPLILLLTVLWWSCAYYWTLMILVYQPAPDEEEG